MGAQTIRPAKTRDHTRSILKGLASTLVINEQVTTTKVRAKALVPYFEKLVTRARKQDLSSYRLMISKLGSEEAAKKMHHDLAKRFSTRPGGYTRTQFAKYRLGDDTKLVKVSLTEAKATENKPAQNKAQPVKAAKGVTK